MRPIRPGANLRRAMYAASALLVLSGLAWLLAHYVLPLPEDAARHPLEAWSIRVHGAAAMLGLAVFGSLWSNHVLGAWPRRRHAWSGGAMVALWLGLILSGYGLYYLADETWRNAASTLHIAAGLALPLGLLAHLTQIQRRRAAARSAT